MTEASRKNNIDFFQFKSIQNLLDDSLNIQINKYQFLVSFDCIVNLADLLDTQCFFYQYKKIGMYLIEHISLNRMKKDVLTDLPKKQEQMLCVKMDENQRRIYDKVLNNLRYEIQRMPDRFEIKNNSVMLKGLLLLQEICCHPQLVDNNINEGCKESVKFDLLIELLQSLYFNSHKVVVFSRFTRMLKIIEKGIAALHLNYYYLDGKTQDRIAVVDEFERSNNGVFLISLKAGGTGLNLTSADTAIIYDPWWNPAAEKQAEDRIYRIGQTQNVMIYRLIIEDSVEEKVQELQKKKTELSTQLLDGHEMPLHIDSDMMRKLIMN